MTIIMIRKLVNVETWAHNKYECPYSVMIANSHRIIRTNKKTSTGYLGIIAILQQKQKVMLGLLLPFERKKPLLFTCCIIFQRATSFVLVTQSFDMRGSVDVFRLRFG